MHKNKYFRKIIHAIFLNVNLSIRLLGDCIIKCKNTIVFETDKIYFHFGGEKDDDFSCKDDGIGGDGRDYSSV